MGTIFEDYLNQNQDVAKARTDPTSPYYQMDDISTVLSHYGEWGYDEGRGIGLPTSTLQSAGQSYLTGNQDVANWAAGTPAPDWLDALTHYGKYGQGEGRPFDLNVHSGSTLPGVDGSTVLSDAQELDFSDLGLPGAGGQFGSALNTLTDMLPQYKTATEMLMGLPGEIDNWADQEAKRYRVTGDEISDAMSKAANMRAGKGIMGGTESDNLRAKLLSEVTAQVNEKKSAVLKDAMLAKTSLVPAMTQEMRTSAALLSNLFGMSTDANINVANIIAQMVQSGYTG